MSKLKEKLEDMLEKAQIAENILRDESLTRQEQSELIDNLVLQTGDAERYDGCQIVARDWEHERGVRVRINKGGVTTNRMRLFAERVIPSGTKNCWNVDKRKYEYTASNDVPLYIVEEQELL